MVGELLGEDEGALVGEPVGSLVVGDADGVPVAPVGAGVVGDIVGEFEGDPVGWLVVGEEEGAVVVPVGLAVPEVGAAVGIGPQPTCPVCGLFVGDKVDVVGESVTSTSTSVTFVVFRPSPLFFDTFAAPPAASPPEDATAIAAMVPMTRMSPMKPFAKADHEVDSGAADRVGRFIICRLRCRIAASLTLTL